MNTTGAGCSGQNVRVSDQVLPNTPVDKNEMLETNQLMQLVESNYDGRAYRRVS